MEPYSKNQGGPNIEKTTEEHTENRGKGRVWAGMIVITVGSIWIAREAGADIPRWVTSWPMFLVALGLFIGARHNFRNWVWLIPVGVGAAMLVDRIFWEINIKPFIWPAVIIVVGLFMIFKPKRKDRKNWSGGGDWSRDTEWNRDNTTINSGEDTIEAVSVFGSTRKNILSKNFRGGEVVNFFGGTDLNLSQADITGPVVLELTQVFGGAKLIVPSNWRIQSELVSVFGGVEDKRMLQPNIDPTKVLILKGTNVFGGLEIKSF